MKRFSVKYVERGGMVERISIFANSKGEARRIAEEKGCEDIIGVTRIGWPIGTLIVLLLIAAGVVCLAVK